MSKKIALLVATLATVIGMAAPAHADTTGTTATAATCVKIKGACIFWP
jgi:hypothetical protein